MDRRSFFGRFAGLLVSIPFVGKALEAKPAPALEMVIPKGSFPAAAPDGGQMLMVPRPMSGYIEFVELPEKPIVEHHATKGWGFTFDGCTFYLTPEPSVDVRPQGYANLVRAYIQHLGRGDYRMVVVRADAHVPRPYRTSALHARLTSDGARAVTVGSVERTTSDASTYV